jgi:hypothetical protein
VTARFDIIQPDQAAALITAAGRPINRLFWHCSASDRPEHDSARVMHQWHLDRKWAEIGYNLFIRKDGKAEMGRAWSKIPAAQSGHNTGTLAFCLHGLKAVDTPQHGAFPRARSADDRDDFTLLNAQVDILQNGVATVALDHGFQFIERNVVSFLLFGCNG